jgi:putative transcriptional regulator
MTDAFKSIEQGLKEAIAHARGEATGIIHEIDIPDPQADFARSIGVKKATLLNWEQRRRNPEGPARVLLALIAADPKIVQRTLAG